MFSPVSSPRVTDLPEQQAAAPAVNKGQGPLCVTPPELPAPEVPHQAVLQDSAEGITQLPAADFAPISEGVQENFNDATRTLDSLHSVNERLKKSE